MPNPNVLQTNALSIDYNTPLTGASNETVLDALTIAPETMDPQLHHDALHKAANETTLDGRRKPFGVNAGPNAYGDPRVRRGAQFDNIFAFRGTVVANPQSGNSTPAFVASKESFEGNKFTDVYIELDDGNMILIRRTAATHGKTTQAEQKFEAMNTKRTKGQSGSPSNPKEMTAEELDGLVVTPGRPFRTGKDAQGRSLVTQENVKRVFAVNMDFNDTSLTGKVHPAEENTIRRLEPKDRFNEVHRREMDKLRAQQAAAQVAIASAVNHP